MSRYLPSKLSQRANKCALLDTSLSGYRVVEIAVRSDVESIDGVGDVAQPDAVIPMARGGQDGCGVVLAGGGLQKVGIRQIAVAGGISAVGDDGQPAVGVVGKTVG